MTGITIQLTEIDDFLSELALVGQELDDTTMRACTFTRPSATMPSIWHVRVVASIVHEGDIIEFCHYCGNYIEGDGSAQQKCSEIAERLRVKLATAVDQYGLKMRIGRRIWGNSDTRSPAA